jgi:hypothetical protein
LAPGPLEAKLTQEVELPPTSLHENPELAYKPKPPLEEEKLAFLKTKLEFIKRKREEAPV